MNKLFPEVSFLKIFPGTNILNEPLKIFFKNEKVNVFKNFDYRYELVDDKNNANVFFEIDESLKDESYQIFSTDGGLIIRYSTSSGAFYSTRTLKQIFRGNVRESKIQLNNFEIKDEPCLKTRGYMLDISRDKVPTLKTIFFLIDFMSDLKMNHLELYVEGFSFEYRSFKEFLEKDGYISINEYKDIEKYANEYFIDLVPNQNGFGHMAKWIKTDKFKDLAVCPEGIVMWGRHRDCSTLNPLDPRSIELVAKMYQDMLPVSNSEYFNMNFDEPFELGYGKTEGMAVDKLYLDYTLKAYEEIKKYHKRPLIWGDVLLKHPNSWNSLPKDMIFIDWGYDSNYPFMKHAKTLKEKNISFMCAPGTTAWCSFFGRYLDWYDNIRQAIDACKTNDGEGVILTDWGDFGHLQFLPVTYAPLAFMGMYSWNNKEGTILTIRDYLNQYIFKDKNNILADLLIDLSNYYRYDVSYGGNGTRTFYTFMWACAAIKDANDKEITYFKEKIGNGYLPYAKFRILRKFLNSKLEELDYIDMENPDNLLVKDEIIQTIKLLKMIHKVSLAYNDEVELLRRVRYMEEVVAQKEAFISEQKRLWLLRNKSGGLKSSLYYIECFMEFALKTLNYLLTIGENNEKN